MKTATWIFGALAALFAVSVDADGVCYDPDRNGNGRNVAGDMAQIRAKGFSHVRTYISSGIAETVAASGLRSMLGIPYENRGENMEPHLAAAERAVKTGTVDYIMVGNENLANMGGVPREFIDFIQSVKRRFPNVRVGTVQRSTELIKGMDNLGDLVGACDVIGVNIHPFFTNLPSVRKSAIEETMAQWNSCKSRVNGFGKPLILTETGWPSSGSTAGNVGSIESAQAYWNSYKSSGVYGQLADSDKYYFQFFDTPKKGPEFEKTYGLFTDVGGQKLNGVGGVPAPAPTPAPTTPAPTTPAPTTPEPTTVSPSSNSTSGSGDNESGIVAGLGSASAGSESQEVGQEESADLGIATDTDATTGSTQAPTDNGATETGDNNNNSGDATEANTKTSSSGSDAGLVVVIMLGVAAVGGAFAFIYKARQKAAEMERSESKSFDVSITPGGACVL